MKKKLFTFALLPAVALGAAGATVATQVTAHGGSGQIEELADKLNLDEAKIEAAFKEMKAEHKAEFEEKKAERAHKAQTNYENRLQKAVEAGDITEAQKQLIVDKQAELRATWEQEQADLKNWSEQNNIDLTYLFGHRGFRGHGMFKGFKILNKKSE